MTPRAGKPGPPCHGRRQTATIPRSIRRWRGQVSPEKPQVRGYRLLSRRFAGCTRMRRRPPSPEHGQGGHTSTATRCRPSCQGGPPSTPTSARAPGGWSLYRWRPCAARSWCRTAGGSHGTGASSAWGRWCTACPLPCRAPCASSSGRRACTPSRAPALRTSNSGTGWRSPASPWCGRARCRT